MRNIFLLLGLCYLLLACADERHENVSGSVTCTFPPVVACTHHNGDSTMIIISISNPDEVKYGDRYEIWGSGILIVEVTVKQVDAATVLCAIDDTTWNKKGLQIELVNAAIKKDK